MQFCVCVCVCVCVLVGRVASVCHCKALVYSLRAQMDQQFRERQPWTGTLVRWVVMINKMNCPLR